MNIFAVARNLRAGFENVKADLKKIELAFPEYEVIGISAKYGKNLEEFYESIFKLSKKI